MRLEAGTLYINGEPLGEVGELRLDEETYTTDDTPGVVFSPAEGAEFTGTARLSKRALLVLFGIWGLVVKLCPDRKVAHLIAHGRKQRTRRKNWNRAARLLEKEGST